MMWVAIMKQSNSKKLTFTLIIGLLVSVLYCTSTISAADSSTILSGRVINENGDPVPDIHLAIKPVQFGEHRDLKQRTHFLIWQRVVTGKDGEFSFKNIDPVSSQLVIFPEHGSDLEIHSIEIGSLTFYSIAFRQGLRPWFGKPTFAVEPGEHLDNVIVHVKEPRMRIRGRVLYQDGTPLINERIEITISKESVHKFDGGESRSGGRMRSNFETDNEGYFVIYYGNEGSTYDVSMTYKGFSVASEPIILEKGERYDNLVFKLKNAPRTVYQETVWIVNPTTGNTYKRIQCANLQDAKDRAARENAYLVAINDEAKQKWLEGLFKQRKFFWIGLIVPDNDREWLWDNGQPLAYTNWRKGQQPKVKKEMAGTTGVALDFYAKKWVAIQRNSPFRAAIKMAIIEKDQKNTNNSEAD